MKQREAVVQTIDKLWWVATLGQINHHVFEIKDCEWKSQTPFASIRRIVQQTPEEIYKIKPWLYWLVKNKKNNEEKWIIEITEKNESSKEIQEMNHYYYQWLLVEIWVLEKYDTYVPPQDQNKLFINKKLSEIITVHKLPQFSYEHLIKRTPTIDVIWFNERGMPNHFYEVEHSTDIQNSLVKFVDLQDFNTKFTIVADRTREKQYQKVLSQIVFKPIENRVNFFDYETLSSLHTKTYEYYTTKNSIQIF